MADAPNDEILELILLLRLLRKHFGDQPQLRRLIEGRLALLGSPFGMTDPESDLFTDYSPRTEIELLRRIDRDTESHRELVNQQIFEISSRIEAVASAATEAQMSASREQLQTMDTLHNFLWLTESGVNIREAHLTRFVPVRIFVGDPIPNERIREQIVSRVEELVRPLGFERAYELPDETGSWWKKFTLKTTAAVTHKEVTKRLKKGEQALELRYLDKPQAEANLAQAQAAAALINALDKTSSACIQAGSLLVLKRTGDDGKPAVIARTLSTGELKRLEENQAMLRQPDNILEYLGLPPPQE